MSFPPHIASVLDHYGVTAATRASLFDLYLSVGSRSLDAFANMAERFPDASQIEPQDVESMMPDIVRAYLQEMLPQWIEGRPTPSFWAPRAGEGRATGMASPLGMLPSEAPGLLAEIGRAARRIAGEGQPVSEGVLILGRNSHFGGRSESITFDVVPAVLENAMAVATAEGRQHTIPGSVGETSGTVDATISLALLSEIQPNVLKPSATRNTAIRRIYGRHRNWHLVTLTAALLWLEEHRIQPMIVRGDALAATHQVNEAKPIGPEIAAFHDRTVDAVMRGLGMKLTVPTEPEEKALVESGVLLNTGLRALVAESGAAAAVRVARWQE